MRSHISFITPEQNKEEGKKICQTQNISRPIDFTQVVRLILRRTLPLMIKSFHFRGRMYNSESPKLLSLCDSLPLIRTRGATELYLTVPLGTSSYKHCTQKHTHTHYLSIFLSVSYFPSFPLSPFVCSPFLKLFIHSFHLFTHSLNY